MRSFTRRMRSVVTTAALLAGLTVPGVLAAAPAAATPEQILAGRFARGEIDEDEFHQRMAALRAETAHPGSAATPS